MKNACLIAVVLGLFGACTEVPPPVQSTFIELDGSSSVFPIAQEVIHSYNHVFPEITFSLSLSGTSNGFNKFCQGKLEINNASRQMNEDEKELCKKNGVDFLELKIANDAIVMAVNPKNTWCANLNLEQLRKIWANDEIVMWSDLNKAWPVLPINFYGPGKLSGTHDVFFQILYPENPKNHRDVSTSEDHNAIVLSVFRDSLALGYFSLPYLHSNQNFTKAIGIDDLDANNGIEAVLPSVESVTNLKYVPFQRPLYLYVNKSILKNDAHFGFLKYFLSHMNEHSANCGFAPMNQFLLEDEIKKLNAAREGVMAN